MSTRSRSGLVLLLLLLQFLVAACVQPPATITRSSKASPVPDRLVVRGGELDYRVTGSGEPVLLIHGSVFADAFDALTTDRSYRPALSTEQALHIMQSEAGRVFDPNMFNKFKALMDQPSKVTQSDDDVWTIADGFRAAM